MKITGIPQMKRLLAKRLKEVGAVRDRLRDDIGTMQDLEETCDRAYENIEYAIEALSELA